jgi:hypothetical protein
MNIERYNILIEMSRAGLLSTEDQEELMALSTEILYDMMKNNKLINEALTRLRNR